MGVCSGVLSHESENKLPNLAIESRMKLTKNCDLTWTAK